MSHPPPTSAGAFQPPQHRNQHNQHNSTNISSNDEQYSASSLRTSYRAFASGFIVAARNAEKVATTSNAAAAAAPVAQQAGHPGTLAAGAVSSPTLVKAAHDAKVQYDNSIQMLLKQKANLRRTATTLESKLRGDGKDVEALHCLLKSSPCVGVRGRKRRFES